MKKPLKYKPSTSKLKQKKHENSHFLTSDFQSRCKNNMEHMRNAIVSSTLIILREASKTSFSHDGSQTRVCCLLDRNVLSKNIHKFLIIICSRKICSFAVKSAEIFHDGCYCPPLGFGKFSLFLVE